MKKIIEYVIVLVEKYSVTNKIYLEWRVIPMIRIAAVDDDSIFLQTLKEIISLQINNHQYFTPNTAIPVFGGVGYDLCSVYVHMIHITATAFTYFERSSKIEIWNRRTKRRNQKHPRAEKNRIRKYLA